MVNLNFDILVFDEAHFGGCTKISKNLINNYVKDNTVLLFLTATFNKPIVEYDIPKSNQYIWGFTDESDCRNNRIDDLQERHGKQILNYLSPEKLQLYQNMPIPYIMTGRFEDGEFSKLQNAIKNTVYGYSNKTLLSVKNNRFKFESEVSSFLNYLTGSNKYNDFPNGDKSLFKRIRDHSSNKNSRTKLSSAEFSTILFFLPCSNGTGTTIDTVSECLKKSMMKNNILSKFKIIILNSNNEYKVKNLRSHIEEEEEKAKSKNCDGLIILAGKQCSMGITLNLVDLVVIMNDSQSGDEIFQMMCRSMTESDNGNKKFGYVYVHHINTVVNLLVDYQNVGKNLSPPDKIRYIIENNIICIDDGLFVSKENKSGIIERLIESWHQNPINQIDRLRKNLESYSYIIDNLISRDDQKKLNKMFSKKLSVKDKSKKELIFDTDVDEQKIDNGNKITIETDDVNPQETENENPQETENEDNDDKNKISFSKDIVPSVIFLSCCLTMRNEKSDIETILLYIKDNKLYRKAFDYQTEIWWNINNIDYIIYLFGKYVNKNSFVNSIVDQMKYNFNNLLDKPEKLLEFINENLTPKVVEKKTNGEVFTPMTLVNEMLDKLDYYYQQEHEGISIFSNPNFIWFDPAAGIGNFPIAVYLRLMNGLQDQFKFKNARKKHILSKMLYMSELNPKNVLLMSQIFQSEKYKLNVFCGDTLEDLDVKKEWNIEKFDVIMGNPPYNSGGIKSHTGKLLNDDGETKTLWPSFVKKSFELTKTGGYITFLTPLSWLKKSHPCNKMIFDYNLVYLELWDNSRSKRIIKGEIPISIYLSHLIEDKKPCNISSYLERNKVNLQENILINEKISNPLAYFSIYYKLYDFINKNKCPLEIETNCVQTKKKITSFILPDKYSIDDLLAIDTYTIKEGIKVKKIDKPHKDQSLSKLIISNKSELRGLFIDDGRLGLCGNHKYYILGNDLEYFKEFLEFKIFKLICNMIKYSQDFIEKDMFVYVPDIRKITNKKITEDHFYKLLCLSDKEILSIKSYKSKSYKD